MKLKNKSRNQSLLLIVSAVAMILSVLFIFTHKKKLPLNSASKIPPIQQYQHQEIPIFASKSLPVVSATNFILVDNSTNSVLLSHRIHDRIYPASITKLATALTALNIYPLDELITVGVGYTNGQNMKLVPGESLTVKSLVNALLVYSANDAAFNLASHHQDGVFGFVK